ncbi:YbgA family protein [Priestia taiwanensis]|uniref:DUF1722 domain-containing protein n=1 Tax=Priestia taiwanensis TaxID=1347902 RepID=A0A917AMR4_9BACI|nr:DUF523 and DUF1722 domain-containing protein [Priestia taiwanensis]MBM7362307.1 uncharacterized protein YbgA (DUF1722 family)/uncharacterized protein YbbK (DUF523 family) [Priestia taiwanensis]GGE61129.1 hypothetical protein GCM10007140_09300 [Priestia taiwanensis]
MNEFSTPTVVVSKCLEFEACRYNGDVIFDETVKSLRPFVTFIPVCPEVEIGLGIPRETIRIISESSEIRLIQPSTGKDVTDEMNTFSDTFLQSLPEVDGFLLKNRSPSCGIREVKVYKGTQKGAMSEKGSGLFGGKVLDTYGHLAVEEEGRLKNFTIREHYFTKLFTLASFREIKHAPTLKKLLSFHSNNKYLFMAYNQTRLKELGRIVANHEQKDIVVVTSLYENKLYELFARSARYTSHVNVCQHIFGYFSKQLHQDERIHFLSLLDKYVKKKLPLSTLTSLLKSWTLRFNNTYLKSQTYFQPYPEDLVAISDSGKGRDY